jgi:dipeptidyl aminopeptidase/acylaminoacyl peptidase
MSRLLICVSALFSVVFPVQAQSKDDPLPAGAIARLGETRYRNVGRVFSIAFAPDGKTLLAGAWDGSIRLWDLATGKELRQYTGHKGWVRSVAFAPDGKTFASGGKDKIIRLWETATGKELRRYEGHQNWIQYLAFSPDGKVLASRSTGQTLRLWDTASVRQVRQIDLQPYTSASVAFSPDSQLLAYPRDVSSIVLLDLVSNKEVWRITGPIRWYRHLAFSPDGTILAVVSETNAGSHPLHLWNAANGKELRRLAKAVGSVWALSFSPDGRLVATAEGGYTLRIWELATRGERCRFSSPENKPSVLAFSPDGRTLAQGSEDITVLLWDVTGLQGKDRPSSMSLTAKELQGLWAELASADAAAAYGAIKKLVAGSKDSVPFIQEHICPVAPADSGTIARLVADLDSDRFERRDQATERLEKLVESAEPELRQALRGNPPLERRQRIERLLEKVSGERENPSPQRLRTWRALEALERMDTPAARQALLEYAKGAPAADLTKEAKAAVERLSKRPG